VEVSGPIEPRIFLEARHVDDQRVALPTALRPAHPRVARCLVLTVHIDGTNRALVLIHDQDLFRGLKNLEGEGHVIRPGNTRSVALKFRLTCVVSMGIIGDLYYHPLFEVFLLFSCRPGLVGNFIPLNDTLAPRLGPPGAHDFRMRAWLGRMGQDVPICRGERLPNPIQVGFAVGRSGGRIRGKCLGGRGLTRHARFGHSKGGHNRRCQRHRAPEPNVHEHLYVPNRFPLPPRSANVKNGSTFRSLGVKSAIFLPGWNSSQPSPEPLALKPSVRPPARR
jgi:hypothetical protein